MSVEQFPLKHLGRPIKGPTALGSDPRRFWNLTRALAVTEFKLTFFGSVLGYLWSLMRPLMLFGVLYVVFTKIVHLGTGPFYAEGLLLGIVLFSFLNEATSGAVTCLLERENLVRKIEFPRLAVPLAKVLTSLFNLTLNLVPVFVFLIIDGASVRVSWLELVPLIALLAAFATGLSMILSSLYVRYRDVRPIWDVVMQVAFYASPIFYTIELVISKAGKTAAHVMMVNPFATILQQARHAVVSSQSLTAAQAIGGTVRLLVPLGIVVLVIVLGYRIFSRAAPRIAELL